jgi:hypothetical protein
MRSQIELVGILHIVYSSIGILIAIVAFVVLSGIGWMSGDATAMGVLGIISILVAGFLVVVSIPGLIAGIGLLKLKPWARILTIVVSCLEVFNIPFGTALGVYSFYVLMSDEAIQLLSAIPVAGSVVPKTA